MFVGGASRMDVVQGILGNSFLFQIILSLYLKGLSDVQFVHLIVELMKNKQEP
jgi:hypothetical protein